MLRNNYSSDKRGREQSFDSNDPVFGGANRVSVFINNLFKGEMETKLLIGVMYAIGIPSWLFGVMLNAGTWKADVLFVISIVCFAIYIPFIVRKLIHLDTMRRLSIKEKQREFDRGRGEPPAPTTLTENEKLARKIDRLNRDGDEHRNMR